MNNSTTRRTSILLAFSLVFGVSFANIAEANHKSDRCEDVFVELDETRVYTRIGNNFKYEIETTGGDPESFDADHLPEGLRFDEENGVINGSAEEEGTFRVELTAENDCSEDTATLRIVVREDFGNTDDANVTLTSTFIENDEKGYVYLTDIPYTGAGDVLQLSLIGFALALWGAALGFALLTPEKKERMKQVFARNTMLVAEASVTSEALPFFQVALEEEDLDEIESEELQILRSSAHEEKVLFSESALKTVVTKSQALGGPSLELLSTVIAGAKATYPREDGFLKINNERIAEILA